MMLVSAIILILLVTAYLRLPLIIWSVLLAAALIAFSYFNKMDASQSCLLLSIFVAIIIPLNIKVIR